MIRKTRIIQIQNHYVLVLTCSDIVKIKLFKSGLLTDVRKKFMDNLQCKLRLIGSVRLSCEIVKMDSSV